MLLNCHAQLRVFPDVLKKSNLSMSTIVNFVASMLRDKSTILRLDDHTSEPINIDNILVKGARSQWRCTDFYNADLVEISKEDAGESAETYVDDAILTAAANSFEEAHKKIKDMMMTLPTVANRSNEHHSHSQT
jgi:hypothetical protein